MFCESFDSSFGGVVSGIARRIGDALFRAGNDNLGGLALGAETGEESGNAIDDAKEVCINYLCPNMSVYQCMIRLHDEVTLWKYSVSSHPLLRPMPAFSIRRLTCPKSISTLTRKSLHSSNLLTSMA